MLTRRITGLPGVLFRYGRTFSLLAAMLAGVLFPDAHRLSFLISYQLAAMLFLSFLGLRLGRSALHPSLFLVLLANVGVGVGAFLLLRPADLLLAQAAFLVGISPTAVSAPVIAGFLDRRVDYVTAAVLAGIVTAALLLPWLLPWVAGSRLELSVRDVAPPVLAVVFVPLLLAALAGRLPAAPRKALFRLKVLSFPLWLATLFLVVANASDFLGRDRSTSWQTVVTLAAVSLTLCVANFSLGALLGGKRFREEASQSLGQKNLSLTIWLGLTFLSPVVALGPTFYIAWHNIYNSIQLYLYTKKRAGKTPRTAPPCA